MELNLRVGLSEMHVTHANDKNVTGQSNFSQLGHRPNMEF